MEQLTTDSFDSAISKGKTIVDFWAEWCGPCKMLGPIYEELSKEIKGVRFAKLNVDDYGEKASDHGVRGIPTMILFENGKEIDRIVGFMPKEALKQKISKAFS